MPKPISRHSKRKLADIPGLDEALIRHRRDTAQTMFQAERTPRGDLRSLARVLAFLQHDTPLRQSLLNQIGLPTDALSSRQVDWFAKDILQVLENQERIDLDIPWSRQEEFECEQKIVQGLNTRRLSDVIEREVEWLWSMRIPRNKVTLINGDPNVGKTWVTLDLVARITRGADLPGGDNPFGSPRAVLWISGEDDDGDTIVPRLRMLGADITRVHSLRYVMDKSKECSLNLSQHLGHLEAWLEGHPLVVLVVIDPLAAFLGAIDSHRNADVRRLMTPLSQLASESQVSIIGINHLSKGAGENAMYRGMGSIAFVAAARSSWLVSRDPAQPDRRLFTNVKNNLASEDVGGLAFRVGDRERGIVWEPDAIATTANEALRIPDTTRAPQRAAAMDWLRDLLREGPVTAEEIWAKAKADGLCEKTVKVAKKELGVRTEKTGGIGGNWVWSLAAK